MPDADTKTATQPDLQQVISEHHEIVATLIRSLIRVPGFPASFRDGLYAHISEVKKATDASELAALCKSMENLCSAAVAEIDPQVGLKDQENEMRRIVEALGDSIKSIAEVNANAGNSLDTHMDDLHDVIVADGEPVQFSKKIEAIANSIRETTKVLKKEVQHSRGQVKDAGSRIQHLETELKRSRAESLKDGLTSLSNRRAFNLFIAKALSSFDPDKPWCLIVADIDHFKKVNDTHGHIIGDALLIKLSHALREQVVAPAFLARYGGEEFVIMLPEASLQKGAAFCDNILTKIRHSRWQYRSQVREITISAALSAGVAMQNKTDTPEALIARADKALYLSKERGRDRFYTEEDLG
ncbi:MAG: GGDEF domain-containing protein [Planctomycetes bacterium]|nr:GGDEF domain-containing protein [Planctomycetota bacterium]